MIEIKAPQPYHLDRPSVFLAGSIEMGKAVDWQQAVVEKLQETNLIILNPRRETWDESWHQTITDPEFREQVEWELDALTAADFILFNFIPDTLSPISLLELGLFKDKQLFVCCPDGYWRKGNIEVVCKRFGIPLFNKMEDAMEAFLSELGKSTTKT
jgi:hypothetical protein